MIKDSASLMALINIIVEEHIKLALLISEIKISDDITKVHDYFLFHTLDEETIMTTHNYPDIEQHKAEHEYLLRLINSLSAAPFLAKETKIFLTKIVTDHINKHDYKIFDYLEGKRVNDYLESKGL